MQNADFYKIMKILQLLSLWDEEPTQENSFSDVFVQLLLSLLGQMMIFLNFAFTEKGKVHDWNFSYYFIIIINNNFDDT